MLFLKNSITKKNMPVCIIIQNRERKVCNMSSSSAVSRSGPRPRPRPEPPRPTLHWSEVFSAQPSLDDLTNLIIADTPSPGQSASDYLDVVVIKFNDFLFSSLVINYWSNQSPAGRQAARSQH